MLFLINLVAGALAFLFGRHVGTRAGGLLFIIGGGAVTFAVLLTLLANALVVVAYLGIRRYWLARAARSRFNISR